MAERRNSCRKRRTDTEPFTGIGKTIQEYSSLYTEWQQNDETIKKIRVHCEALRENVSQCRLTMQQVSSAKEQLALLQNAASAEQKRFEVVEKALDTLRQELLTWNEQES